MSDRPARRLSDTVRFTDEELAELRSVASDAPTGRECPECSAMPREPACPTCAGTGWVSFEAWHRFMREHDPSSLIPCPKCKAVGTVERVLIRGLCEVVSCDLCGGQKRCRANFAEAWVREFGDGTP